MREISFLGFFYLHLSTKTAEAETTKIQKKTMLQPKLTSAPPEGLKDAYVQKGNEWVLDNLADDHPKMLENKTLIEEKRTAEAELNTLKANVGNIERERDEAKAKSLPNGYRSVLKADAEFLDKIKPLGKTVEEIQAMTTENEQYKTEKAQNAQKESLKRAFEFAEVKNPEKAFGLKATDNLSIEWKTVDGKQTPYFVSEKDGAKSETLFDKKFVLEADGFKDYAGELFSEDGKRYIEQESGKTGDGLAKSAAASYINSTYERPDKKD